MYGVGCRVSDLSRAGARQAVSGLEGLKFWGVGVRVVGFVLHLSGCRPGRARREAGVASRVSGVRRRFPGFGFLLQGVRYMVQGDGCRV